MSASPPSFPAQRSGLKILLTAWSLDLGLMIARRVFNTIWIPRLGASTSEHETFMLISRCFHLAFLAVSVATVLGTSYLGGLRVRIGATIPKDPYREASRDTAEIDPQLESMFQIARGSVAASALLAIGLFVARLIAEKARRTYSLEKGLSVEDAFWMLSSVLSMIAHGSFIAWAARAGKALGAKISPSFTVGLPVLVVGSGSFWLLQTILEFRVGALLSWITFGAAFFVALGFVLLIRILIEAIEKYTGPAGDAAPGLRRTRHLDREHEAVWIASASGLERYQGALRGRIVAMIVGVGLVVLATLSRSTDLAKGVMVLLPMAGLLFSVLMMAGLYADAKTPAEGAGELARFALITLVFATLVDVYAVSLALDVMSDRLSAAYDAVKAMPYVQAASMGFGVVHLLLLLASFRRLARAVESEALAKQAGGLMTLWGWLFGLAVLAQVGVAMKLTAFLPIVGLPLLILAVVAIVRYMSLLADLRRETSAWIAKGPADEAPASG